MSKKKEVSPNILGQLSKVDLDKLLTTYPKVTAVVFDTGTNELAIVYLKEITREVWSFGNKMHEKDTLQCAEYLLNNLQIAGYPKEEIIKDLSSLANCASTIQEILFVKKGYIVDLKKN